jgi:hypothetical protein
MSDPNPTPKAPAGEGERVRAWPDLATRLREDPDYQRAVRLLDEFGWSSNVSRDGRLMSKMYVVAEAVADAFAADRRAAEARADAAEEVVKALRATAAAEARGAERMREEAARVLDAEQAFARENAEAISDEADRDPHNNFTCRRHWRDREELGRLYAETIRTLPLPGEPQPSAASQATGGK